MAKRKQATRQQNRTQRSAELTRDASQAFNEGELEQFHSHLTSLRHLLTTHPDQLQQAETEIALAITDEGTPHENRIAAFEAVVGVLEGPPKEHYKMLYNCGSILDDFGQHYVAIEKYEQTLRINSDSARTLNNYGAVLYKLMRYDEAIVKFDTALLLNPNFINTLHNCGLTLVKLKRYDEANQKFEHVLQQEPNRAITLLAQATSVFEPTRQYDKAIANLERAIKTSTLDQDSQNFIYLILGRLHYLRRSYQQGNDYFNLAIENSDDKDAAIITSAEDIIRHSPYPDTAINLLIQITKESPHYQRAWRMLGLNLSPEQFWQFTHDEAEEEAWNTEKLSRALYHKMNGEIVLLKDRVEEIRRFEHPELEQTLAPLAETIEDTLEEIRRRRAKGEREVNKIPRHDFKSMVHVISETAHDVADYVNNQLYGLKMDMRELLWEMPPEHPHYQPLQQLLHQVEAKEAALNDLKAIHEGTMLRYSRVPVNELFEVWAQTPTLPQATIKVEFGQNKEQMIKTDAAKIKSFLSELVANSLKHNQDSVDIVLRTADEQNPSDLQSGHYLHINYQDNGKGVPADKKQWIFNPLNTTSGEGSGLGLYLIKKTITQLGGSIVENGTHGVNFDLYVPYQPQDNVHEDNDW